MKQWLENWLEDLIEKVVHNRLDSINNKISALDSHVHIGKISDQKLLASLEVIQKISDELNNRLLDVEKFQESLDQDFIYLTKADLVRLMDRQVVIYKEDVDKKISDLMQYVRTKVANMKDASESDLALLKKVAEFEGLRDAIEHRRSTQELLGCRKNLQEDLISGSSGIHPSEINAQIRLLNWILGEEDDAN